MSSSNVDIPKSHSHEVRTGLSKDCLKQAIIENLVFEVGRFPKVATELDYYDAFASAIRDRLLQHWVNTIETYRHDDVKVVCYFSAEYLPGKHLANNLLNLGIQSEATAALQDLSLDFDRIADEEPEPGLGNGGLGRLAACYMDSLATLQVPAIGFGIRYEYGIFDQAIRDGWQVENTDNWLQYGNPWEIRRSSLSMQVSFGGHTEDYTDDAGHSRVRWIPSRIVKAVAYDTPVLGYRVNTSNTLRLWKAEAIESFDFQAFNAGDYAGSVRSKMESENISKVLYPNDEVMSGKELRLEQQYFFVSASLQFLIQLHLEQGRPIEHFDEKWAIQMNDTHPSISVAELMRLLIDEQGMGWEPAWKITVNTLGFTNHTLLPEALEKWPLHLFQGLLPRHLEIIYEINARFLAEVKEKYPNDNEKLRRVSLIDEEGERYVRMAYLATVGSHAVNGVAALHSELLKKEVLPDFFELFPERFSNKTNGITPRRWLALCNRPLASLITSRIGDAWTRDLERLRELEAFVDDQNFHSEWRSAQHQLKVQLRQYIHTKTGSRIEPSSMVDAIVKRIHEYKRQHLKVLHILTLYNRIKKNPGKELTPRTFLFGGKAAPGYYMAKLIIKLVNSVAEVVNPDPDVAGRLQVIFLPDYNVTFGEKVYPAADLSEQISLAGKEASGTGNMKFALNGALTVGTYDGANIEIRDAVGHDNFFLFGMRVEQVNELRSRGYRPRDIYESNAELKGVIDALYSGHFSRGDRELFRPLLDSFLNGDPYMLFADYQSYIECQDHIDTVYRDDEKWTRMSILNTARMGRFSSDRAVREYCADIWHVDPVPVELKTPLEL